MFSFPVTIVARTDESIFPLDVMVDIDKIAFVKPILDNTDSFGVQCDRSLLPSAEIHFEDGRVLPVLETAAILFTYLDAYLALDDFYTGPRADPEEAQPVERGVIVPLFKDGSCATSVGSTPD